MNIIKNLKKDTFSEALDRAISVKDNCDTEIAKLVPIGNWALDDDHLLESFAKWRQTFMRFFLSQFVASPASTQGYLKNLSIGQTNRIFFALYVGADLMGHIGLSNIDHESAELDNIIRGISGGHRDLMYFAEKTVLNWAFSTLAVERVYAQVMSKNFMALSLHERFGFSLKERFPLKKIVDGSSVSHEKSSFEEATEKFYLDIVEVSKAKFTESIL